MTNVTTRESYDAVIIVAGLVGLVTGAYLARSGLTVLICEQAPQVAGDDSGQNYPVGGVHFHPKRTLGSNLSWTDLQKYSGIFIATGTRCTPIYSSRQQMTNLLRLSSRERLR